MGRIMYVFPLLAVLVLFVGYEDINERSINNGGKVITEQEHILSLANEIINVEPKDWKERENINSFDYLFHRFSQNLAYQKILVEEWGYLNKTATRIGTSEAELCYDEGDDNFCISGRFHCEPGTTDKTIKLFINISDTEDKLIFTFLHEIGHSIQYSYNGENLVEECIENDNSTKEWERLHNEVRDNTLRDYGKSSPQEDFSDSYARYRLGMKMPKEKIDYIKEIEIKAGVIK